jgi:hypothetical protein
MISINTFFIVTVIILFLFSVQALDSGADLQSLRELRQIALSGYYEGQLVLGKRYITGKYGGIDRHQAATFVRGFVQSSQPTHVKTIYRFNELTHSMR